MGDVSRPRRDWDVSLVLGLSCLLIAALVWLISLWRPGTLSSYWEVYGGLDTAGAALCAHGAFALAETETGARRRGLRVAGAAWLGDFALQFVWLGALVLGSDVFAQPGWRYVQRAAWALVSLGPVLGLALAAPRRPMLARAAAAIAVLGELCFAGPGWLLTALGVGDRSRIELHYLLRLVVLGFVILMAAPLARRGAAPDPVRAARGLRRAAAALWVRAITIALFALLATELRGYRQLGGVIPGFIGLVHALVLGWFALGALGAARSAELSRGALTVAAAAALWCFNFVLFEAVSRGPGVTGDALGLPGLALVASVISLSGFMLLVVAVRPLAARRGDAPHPGAVYDAEALGGPNAAASGDAMFASFAHRHHEAKAGPGAGFILCLVIVGMAFLGWFAPAAETRAGQLLGVLAGWGCALAAAILMARICSAAARTLAHTQGLPAARAVHGPRSLE